MKPKILLLTFSILEDISPVDPESINIIKKYSQLAEKKLKGQGLDIVRIEKIIKNNESKKQAIDIINKETPDCVIFQIGVWPSPSLAIDIINILRDKTPIILWAVDNMKILSLVPACQFHGTFDDMGIEHEFIYANPEETEFTEKIKKIALASKVIRELSGSNLGLFGGRYMHMYTGTADPIQVKNIFGIEIVHINEFLLVREAEKIEKNKIKKYSEYLHNSYGKISAPPDVEEKSIRLYLAMEKMLKEYELDFAAVKCMIEVQSDYCSHCLSVSRHIDEGFIISCEADINGAITMQLLKLLSNSVVGFGDVCRVDKKTGVLTVINCGAFATGLSKDLKNVKWPEQKEDLVPGKGTGMTTFLRCRHGKRTFDDGRNQSNGF